ncbi:predicted protein [Uncinocarpus reesii 1704]|uniref:Uncharacterized protein n=1 Tax=Uncinocarpus reesii (strain UAMH 1704) TaxID=336963 RepID=C4JF20_UNCRE|nr:uncharacterized protein UREG_00921 [Uncinocarpus reesii 1704]EEP76073.1 predicted protein [Uncinocarpus reesii 1704]
MQFKNFLAACILGLASLSFAAPAPGSKPDLNFYLKEVMPVQLQRIEDFRSYFPHMTPEQNKYLDELSDKLTSLDFKGLGKLLDEGEAIFKTDEPIKNPVNKTTEKPKRQVYYPWYKSPRFHNFTASLRLVVVHYQ